MVLNKKVVQGKRRPGKKLDDDYLEPDKLNLRNTYGFKIKPYLLQGVEEVNKAMPSFQMTEQELWNLTHQICDAIYDNFNYDKREFKQKMFDIYANIKRENNHELRRKIVTGTMSVYDLIHADTRELAPHDLKRKREIALERHYLRNVILPGSRQNNKESPEGSSPKEQPSPREPRDAFNEEHSDEYSDLDDSESITTVSDGFLKSAENSPKSQVDPEEEQNTLEPEPEANQEKSQQLDSDPKDTMAQESFEMPKTAPKESIFVLQSKKVEVEEEDVYALPDPPDVGNYMLYKVLEKLERRLDNMPAYISKPFRASLKCGHRRVTMLMGRSPILMDKAEEQTENIVETKMEVVPEEINEEAMKEVVL